PCTWNTDFAISRPIVLTSPMDGSPQCGLLRQNHPMALLMPQSGRRPQHQKQTCASQKAMSAQAAAYDAPYPDVRYKGGVRRFPNLVPEFVDSKGAAVGRAAREFWRNEWRGPSVMAIGMTDPVLGPFLAAWGKNDPFFLPAGAEAFKRDMPNAVIRF